MLLGGLLAVVSSLLDMRVAVHDDRDFDRRYVTTLFGTKSEASGLPYVEGLYNQGFAVLLTVAVMVVAAVLAGRGVRAARVATLAAASVFAGVVVAFVVSALHEEELIKAYAALSSFRYEVTYLPGTYLLVLAAVVGLVGAVLVHRAPARHPAAQPEEAVVVHQFTDDDTPPFGIAMPNVERRGG
ncbi:hypothetical protein BBK82_24705 [Lentzea guizhouensis]|uniref:Uncharacterized protein n=1 Tax=Lentzea guizhouensis TaxID=1586287 RepID=A0A1B2HM50_9PSEU|nr:hypothetical protein BBK82_24705 [Lentzea guizhouensis]